MTIFDSLTIKDSQFKKKCIEAKVTKVIQTIENVSATNVYKRRQDQTLAPRLEDKIHYSKLRKYHNLEDVRDEVATRGVVFLPTTSWNNLLKIIMVYERNTKIFTPVTNDDNFKRNDSHFLSALSSPRVALIHTFLDWWVNQLPPAPHNFITILLEQHHTKNLTV